MAPAISGLIAVMKQRIKAAYLLISSIIIGLLHLPFAFAKSAAAGRLFTDPPGDSVVKATTGELLPPNPRKSVYDSLQLELKGLSRQAFEYAKKGFEKLVAEGKLANASVLSIIDFSLPSHQKRLFVIDLFQYKILFNTLVSHGRNSGREWATSFSNQNSSYKSSPGFYITRETYEGKNGYSLKLAGMENGINDNAFERGIVVHGADYVSESLANAQGYIGRSQGCPAVPVPVARPVINTIKNGTCLFIYHPSYVRRSAVLR